MATNPIRQLAGISRNIRNIGIDRLPTENVRVGLLFSNSNTGQDFAPQKACLKMGKLMKWMEMEVFIVEDATIDEFIEITRHFVTDVSESLLIFGTGVNLSKNCEDGLPLNKDKADPGLIYDILSCKQEKSRVAFVMDGVYDPFKWMPSEYGVEKKGIVFMAPCRVEGAELIQYDSVMESMFLVELTKALKENPEIRCSKLKEYLDGYLFEFGMEVFLATQSPQLANNEPFAK